MVIFTYISAASTGPRCDQGTTPDRHCVQRWLIGPSPEGPV